jgi:hypothetical protein
MIAMYLSLYIAAQGQMVSTFDLVALLEGVTINERPEIRNAQVVDIGRYCLYGIHRNFCSRPSASRTPLEAQAFSKLEAASFTAFSRRPGVLAIGAVQRSSKARKK